MELYRKMNDSLEPLGGLLFVDRFVATVAAAAERRAKEAAAEQARLAAQREAELEASRREPAPERSPAGGGGLDLEVEQFMTRDTVEGADDTEIQEFLRERRGFDPTELD